MKYAHEKENYSKRPYILNTFHQKLLPCILQRFIVRTLRTHIIWKYMVVVFSFFALPIRAGPMRRPTLCHCCVVRYISGRFSSRWRELDQRSQWLKPLESPIKTQWSVGTPLVGQTEQETHYIQWKPLIMISLGPALFDNNNWLIILSAVNC